MLAKRMFNMREGWTRDEDWLPERFLTESLELESGARRRSTPETLDAMIEPYYRGRGLDTAGLPTSQDAWAARAG